MHVKCFQTTCHYTSSALTAFIPNSTGMAGIKVGIGPARMLSVLPPALARHLEMCHPKWNKAYVAWPLNVWKHFVFVGDSCNYVEWAGRRVIREDRRSNAKPKTTTKKAQQKNEWKRTISLWDCTHLRTLNELCVFAISVKKSPANAKTRPKWNFNLWVRRARASSGVIAGGWAFRLNGGPLAAHLRPTVHLETRFMTRE